MTITRLWLIRHGEPVPESRGRCYGSLDIGLSEQGRRQLISVAQRLKCEKFSTIYTSPRKRAIQSADILATHRDCAVTIESRLREIDFGDFEGRSYDEIAQSHPDIYKLWMEQPTEVHFPGGESFLQMQERVLDAGQFLLDRHRGQTVAIVTHGGVNRLLLAEALGIPVTHIFRIAQRYGAINLICYLGNYPSVELINGVVYDLRVLAHFRCSSA
jgi:alpha-ribazole phosphatase/probable phosphoglycerate mutase